jgi:hypothetical protein
MCWCYEKQCHGDVDGLMQFGVLAVYSDDLGFFVAAYGQPTLPPGGICADLDHQMQFGVLRVYSDDLGELVKYYGQPNVPPCSGPICVGFDDGWCDENTMPNSEFNFWWVP